MSEQQSPDAFPLRRRFVLALLVSSSALLIWRAIDLQLNEHEFLKDRGDARHIRVVAMAANRGTITDRHGEPLAISTPVNSVWAVPRQLWQAQDRWQELAKLLSTNAEHLRTLIEPRIDREFVYLKRHVEPSLAKQVMALGIDGVALLQENRRYYPTAEVAAHVVGFTNVDDTGQEGVELALENLLSGRPGAKRVLKDRLGRIVENVESIRAPHPGTDVALSIDKRVQFLAYRELKSAVHAHRAKSGSIVVLDVQSGEILAMANQPSFNPNNRSGLKGEYYRNRAVTDVFEPGSTIKPFTIAAALESGEFRPQSLIDTRPGFFAVGRHAVRDMKNYGVIDLSSVIVKSSNVGASKVALSMDPIVLWEFFHRVGFGASTFSGFPGESSGRLTDHQNWRDIEHATMAFGYGLSATSLQLAHAYGVLANDGVAVPTSILRVQHPPNGQRLFSARTALQIKSMLTEVVRSGTGRMAAVSGYHIAGKTGTVHKPANDGYAEDRYVSLFAGMAPATRPKLVAVIVIDEPQGVDYFGGRVAAPIFARVMRDALRLLNIPPDALEPTMEMVALHNSRNKAVAVQGTAQRR